MAALKVRGLFLMEPGGLAMRCFELPDPASGEARIRVAGCGLCHTDISFFTGAVRTRRALPLVLGHEVSGIVEEAPPPFSHLIGRPVIVPAVIPCDACDLCKAGRDNACAAQVMPGNDVHGGFATHMVVPARHLIPIESDTIRDHTLAELSVVADAVTTPYQALHRAGVTAGDLVIIIGLGGIGTYAVQIARAFGAHVAGVDVDKTRLDRMAPFGVTWKFNPGEVDGRGIKKRLLAESGVTTARWRIFEMSGTVAGQELAWTLLPPAGVLGVIGFTMDRPEIRLSNLMALDATAFGSWGCSPHLYPAAIDLVTTGRVAIRPFTELHPLAGAAELFERAADHRSGPLLRRPILVPD